MKEKPEEVCGEPEETESKPEETESKPEAPAPQVKEPAEIEISEGAIDEVMKPIEKKVKEVVFYYWPVLPAEHCLRWKVGQAAMYALSECVTV